MQKWSFKLKRDSLRLGVCLRVCIYVAASYRGNYCAVLTLFARDILVGVPVVRWPTSAGVVQLIVDGIGARFSTVDTVSGRRTQDHSNHGEDSTLAGDLPWSWKDHEDNGLRCHVSGGCGSGWPRQERRHAVPTAERSAYDTAPVWWPADVGIYAEVWTRLSGECYN